MNMVPDDLTINQLLGRVSYFHALFIAPSQPTMVSYTQPSSACDTSTSLGKPMTESPWSVLREIASSLGADGEPTADRCTVCEIHANAYCITKSWISTEQRAYRTTRGTAASGSWAAASASQFTDVFQEMYGMRCAARPVATNLAARPDPLDYPLTTDLLELWASPGRTAPVTSWLNHCADISDVARTRETIRAGNE